MSIPNVYIYIYIYPCIPQFWIEPNINPVTYSSASSWSVSYFSLTWLHSWTLTMAKRWEPLLTTGMPILPILSLGVTKVSEVEDYMMISLCHVNIFLMKVFPGPYGAWCCWKRGVRMGSMSVHKRSELRCRCEGPVPAASSCFVWLLRESSGFLPAKQERHAAMSTAKQFLSRIVSQSPYAVQTI